MNIKLPITILPIEEDGFHIITKVKINEKEANLLIDTGASRTVFDEHLINEFITEETDFEENEKLSTGLGTNSMKSQVIKINSLKLGDYELNNYQAVVLDLKHVNESYKALNLPIVHGVFGGDLLKKYKAVIDYKRKVLRMYK